jgi:hypothetical protein
MNDLYTRLLLPLNRTGLKFMITGSVAVIAYGEPRMTNDVDIVIDLTPDNAYKLHRAYSSSDFYAPPADVMATEAESGEGQFNVVHLDSVMRADFYVAGDDPLHRWALDNRSMEQVAGVDLPFAPIEYLIVRKLEYFRDTKSDRHLNDVAGLLRVSGKRVDSAKLDALIAERELGSQWDAAQKLGRSARS